MTVAEPSPNEPKGTEPEATEPGTTEPITSEPAGQATVAAPSNIAFIKYWGAIDLEEVLPANASISMTLTSCVSRSTVQHIAEPGRDEILLAQEEGLAPAPPSFAQRALAHLETIRRFTSRTGSFRVATENSFPAAAGMASSASGFSALAVAATRALGLDLPAHQLSELARRSGSGSASRSVFGGYVEWPGNAETSDQGPSDAVPAQQIAKADHWDLRDVIAVVETGAKEVSSLEGHRRATSSPYFKKRQKQLPARLATVRKAIEERDFGLLGPVVEEEAIDLHLIAMSSKPAIFYWSPATLAILGEVRKLRSQGIPAYSTMDAGANVHVICQPQDEEAVAQRLEQVHGVHTVIRDGVGTGPAAAKPLL